MPIFLLVKWVMENKIDQYIAGFPENVQVLLKILKKTIKELAPEATETISWGIPTFDLAGHHLVHFAAYKKHIGFYPASSGIEAFKKEISTYKWAKGTVQFPIDKPLPLDLIKKIVKFRIKENLELAGKI